MIFDNVNNQIRPNKPNTDILVTSSQDIYQKIRVKLKNQHQASAKKANVCDQRIVYICMGIEK